MYCYRFEVRQSSESVNVARHLHGNSARIWRNVLFASSRLSFREREEKTRLQDCVYKHTRPLEPITRDLVGFASQEITPSYLCGVLLHFPLPPSQPPASPFHALSLLILQPFPLSIFVPSRSINSEPDSFRIALHREGSS